jgi:transcription-repair coupling factor (superfamily II helicase)
LYCQLLENAVRSLKNMPLRTPLEITVDLPWPAYLPRDYVPAQKLRMEVYRRLSRIRDMQKLEDFKNECRDRYGPIPEPAEWLLRVTEIRLLCHFWQINSIHVDGAALLFSYRNKKRAGQLEEKTGRRLKIIDEKTLYLKLLPEEEEPELWYELLRSLLQK